MFGKFKEYPGGSEAEPQRARRNVAGNNIRGERGKLDKSGESLYVIIRTLDGIFL